MRSAFSLFLALLSCAALHNRALAQDTQPGTQPSTQPGVPKATPLIAAGDLNGGCCPDGVCGPPGRVWVRGEYLLWWTRGFHVPPLVTTSPPTTPIENAGVLGLPTTTILFGDTNVNNDARSGGQITAGLWLNQCQTLGFEASFFGLERQSTFFDASSSGIPILARPFFQIDEPAGPNSLLIAYPGFAAGNIHVAATSNFYGAEALFRANLCCTCCCRLDLLAGYRFLNLNESLNVEDTIVSLSPDSEVPVGTKFVEADNFGTRNNFNGGVIGVDGECRCGCWTFGGYAKVALGCNSREVNISGFTTSTVFGGTLPGSLTALPSNSGRHHDNGFGVVPEFGVRAYYQVTNNIRAGIGYSFLYWTNVVRPGDQVDLVVNSTQLPPGTLAGPARPAFSFHTTDFWAQGLNFGIEFRY